MPVCVCFSCCLLSPSYYTYYQPFSTICLALGTSCCSFSLVLFTLPSLLHFSHTHTPCLPLSPPTISTDPPRGDGWVREGQRETGQACTVENIVYARHKAACNFCSRGDTHKGLERREGEVIGSKGREGDGEAGRKSERIKIRTRVWPNQLITEKSTSCGTNPDWTESQKSYRNIFSVGILQIQGWVKILIHQRFATIIGSL